MRNVRFTAKNGTEKELSVYQNIRIVYDKNDMALLPLNGGGNCFLSIGCAYIGVDFDIDSKRVGGLSDLLGNLNDIQKKVIAMPAESKNALLCIDSDENFQPGTGYKIQFNAKTYYDSKNKILQFGEFVSSSPVYRFLHNAYAQLAEDGTLLGIIVTDIEE